MPRVCLQCQRTYEDPAGFCVADGAELFPELDRYETDEAALTGRVLGARYLVEHVVHAGVGAIVLKVRHAFLERPLVAKLLSPAAMVLEGGTVGRDRFLREARLASSVRHPNVVEITDFGVSGEGLYYLVMEALPGCDLRAFLRRNPDGLPAAEVGRLGGQLASALAAIHAQGIIHRDLKPENIWVLDEQPTQLKLLDFGVAKRTGPIAADGKRLTQHDVVLGTPHYMAPEQICGEPLDAQVDLYALGCILFELASGRPVFDVSADDVWSHHLDERPPTLAQVGVEAPRWLEAAVALCLEKDPQRRPGGGRALVAMLGQREPEAAPSRRAWLWPLVVVLVAAIGVGSWMSLREPEAAPATPPVVEGLPAPEYDGRPEALLWKPFVDTRAFDVVGFVPTATKLARALKPDAELAYFTAPGVSPQGTVDLSGPGRLAASFVFVSPELRRRHEAGERVRCIVSIGVELDRIAAGATTGPCEVDSGEPPTCTYAEIIGRVSGTPGAAQTI